MAMDGLTPVVDIGGNTAAFGETFIMDSLSGARSDIRLKR